MSLKFVVFSAQVFLLKSVLGQCIGNIGNSYDFGNCKEILGNSYGLLNPCASANGPLGTLPTFPVGSSSGCGSFNVQTASPFAPSSISVQSENQIQGPLSVYGTLPFLSAVAFEGSLPTGGSGIVSYQCGDGIGIFEENISASGYDSIPPNSFGERYNSFGAGWNLARSGINEINSCVQSVPNIYSPIGGSGFNYNNGIKRGCGY